MTLRILTSQVQSMRKLKIVINLGKVKLGEIKKKPEKKKLGKLI